MVNKQKGPKPIPTEDRFWSKVLIMGPEECWLWQARINPNGYGQFNPQRGVSPCSAHRFVFQLVNNVDLSSEEFVCHTCDIRACCNPAHLFLGDAKSNTLDMIKKGRMRHNPKPSGINSPCAKLTREDVLSIKSLYQRGETGTSLARKFGVGRTTIGRVLSGKSYGEVI